MAIQDQPSAWGQLLPGKVAVITGAASGIGNVNESGGHVAEQIAQAGGDAIFVRTDVSSDHAAHELAAKTLERFGAIDILMNNAAATALCNQSDRAVHELPETVWDQMLD